MVNLNAASLPCDYNYSNKTGNVKEDFLDSNPIELVYNKKETRNFLHYSGSITNPNLTIVSTDLIDNSQCTVLEDPGSGH